MPRGLTLKMTSGLGPLLKNGWGPALLLVTVVLAGLLPSHAFDLTPVMLIMVGVSAFQLGMGAALLGVALASACLVSFALGHEDLPRLAVWLASAIIASALGHLLRKAMRRNSAETKAARGIIDEMFQEHWAFLNISARTLASSLDYRVTLGKIAKLAVPDLADSCVVDLLEKDGTITRVQRGAEPQPSFQLSKPEKPGSHSLIQEVIRSGRSRRLSSEDSPSGRAEMIVPLRSREHVFGAMTFLNDRAGFVLSLIHI